MGCDPAEPSQHVERCRKMALKNLGLGLLSPARRPQMLPCFGWRRAAAAGRSHPWRDIARWVRAPQLQPEHDDCHQQPRPGQAGTALMSPGLAAAGQPGWPVPATAPGAVTSSGGLVPVAGSQAPAGQGRWKL